MGWQYIIFIRSLGPNLCSVHGVRSVSRRRSVCFICYRRLYNLACRTGSWSGLEVKLHVGCERMVKGTRGRSVSHVSSHWFTGFLICAWWRQIWVAIHSSIYVRLMAVWDLRSESSSTTKTCTWTSCLFQLIYQISLWSDFPWRNFKYADYIWAVHWFALLEVLLQDCRVG